ncbi:MAG: DUF3450 family protein [Planctomycetota bacterium]
MTPTPRRAALALAAVVSAGALALAGDDEALANLARELVTRRSAVEKLASRLELEQGQLRDDLRALALQKADLQRQLQAAELEANELEQGCTERRERLSRQRRKRDAVAPVVRAALADLLVYVGAGLPFKRQARAAELERLASELAAGRLDGEEALGRLWSACEDELRLTRENGLYRQRIELDGQPVLADVAKLGMVLLYFRALDGRVGVVVPAEGGWRCRVARDEDEARRVRALFDALDKHVRTGFFELPNPYAGRTLASLAPVTSQAHATQAPADQGGAR